MSMVDITNTERKLAERVDPAVAGRLEVSNAVGGLGFVNMGQAMEFAKLMCISSVAVPKHLRGNPGACLAVVIQAVEWRLSPYAVANKSYSVNDRLAYESQLIQAVILQRAPIDGRFKVEYRGEGDARVCKVWAKLRGSDDVVDYESPPFGKITPKNSPLWKSDPDQQHFYYSGRALCRRHFPDVLLGVYSDDEIPAGAENARDVTPAKTLSDKLDVLAQTPTNGAAQNGNDVTAASPEGEATEEPTPSAAASPPSSSQPDHSRGDAAAGQAAPDNAQEQSQPAQSGAAVAEWPADQKPRSPSDYTTCTKSWLAKVRAGEIAPADARARWKSEMKLRNDCMVDESVRDPLKEELDAILAEKKAA